MPSRGCSPIRQGVNASEPRHAAAWNGNSAGTRSPAARRNCIARLWLELRGKLVESHGAEERPLLRLGDKAHAAVGGFPKKDLHCDIENFQRLWGRRFRLPTVAR